MSVLILTDFTKVNRLFYEVQAMDQPESILRSEAILLQGQDKFTPVLCKTQI